MVEIKLHDNSKLVFVWVRPDLLSVEVWKPGFRSDQGYFLHSSALLDGEQLRDVVALFLGPRDCAGYQAVGEQ
jgi:hypothetical protein